MRAFLFAKATAATFGWHRVSRRSSHLWVGVPPDFRCLRTETSPMDQERAQIRIASFANAEQLYFASGGTLPRHQAQPCRQLPATLKCARIPDARHQGARRDRSNARNPL